MIYNSGIQWMRVCGFFESNFKYNLIFIKVFVLGKGILSTANAFFVNLQKTFVKKKKIARSFERCRVVE